MKKIFIVFIAFICFLSFKPSMGVSHFKLQHIHRDHSMDNQDLSDNMDSKYDDVDLEVQEVSDGNLESEAVVFANKKAKTESESDHDMKNSTKKSNHDAKTNKKDQEVPKAENEKKKDIRTMMSSDKTDKMIEIMNTLNKHFAEIIALWNKTNESPDAKKENSTVATTKPHHETDETTIESEDDEDSGETSEVNDDEKANKQKEGKKSGGNNEKATKD